MAKHISEYSNCPECQGQWVYPMESGNTFNTCIIEWKDADDLGNRKYPLTITCPHCKHTFPGDWTNE
jgi:hypothetical protein